jgi:hypothetical protein
VDFEEVSASNEALLKKAYGRYQDSADASLRIAFESSVEENAYWLDDYALFRALKNANNGAAWHRWEPLLAKREPSALARAREDLRGHIDAENAGIAVIYQELSLVREMTVRREHLPWSRACNHEFNSLGRTLPSRAGFTRRSPSLNRSANVGPRVGYWTTTTR